jgi:hypothetical protein
LPFVSLRKKTGFAGIFEKPLNPGRVRQAGGYTGDDLIRVIYGLRLAKQAILDPTGFE